MSLSIKANVDGRRAARSNPVIRCLAWVGHFWTLTGASGISTCVCFWTIRRDQGGLYGCFAAIWQQKIKRHYSVTRLKRAHPPSSYWNSQSQWQWTRTRPSRGPSWTGRQKQIYSAWPVLYNVLIAFVNPAWTLALRSHFSMLIVVMMVSV